MRRATTVLLGLLLVFGSTSFGMGHVHAAPTGENSGGLHLDHVHLDSDHHAHAGEPGSAAIDHEAGDAIILSWAASEAMPKRALPCLTAAPLFDEAPQLPATERLERTDEPPHDPPLHAGPPGRAPPVT
jgi:hypothetical protein